MQVLWSRYNQASTILIGAPYGVKYIDRVDKHFGKNCILVEGPYGAQYVDPIDFVSSDGLHEPVRSASLSYLMVLHLNPVNW